MSSRERWVVYPLLYMALFASLKDRFLHSVSTDALTAKAVSTETLLGTERIESREILASEVRTQRLVVTDGGMKPFVVAEADNGGNVISLYYTARPGKTPARIEIGRIVRKPDGSIALLAHGRSEENEMVRFPESQPGEVPAGAAAPSQEGTPDEDMPEDAKPEEGQGTERGVDDLPPGEDLPEA